MFMIIFVISIHTETRGIPVSKMQTGLHSQHCSTSGLRNHEHKNTANLPIGT